MEKHGMGAEKTPESGPNLTTLGYLEKRPPHLLPQFPMYKVQQMDE